MNLRLIASLMAVTALVSSIAQAGNNPHITDLDLSIYGVADYDEFYEPSPSTTPKGPGGFVCSNGWQKITLKAVGVNAPMKTRLNWDSSKIEVWTATNGGTQVLSPKLWQSDTDPMPTNLWVKGVAVSATGPTTNASGDWASCGPEHMTLEAINNGADPTTPGTYYDRIAFTVINVDLDGDIDMDGDIDDDDDPNEDVAAEPCLVVAVNNDTHTTASGDAEVDSADAVINGATDKSEDLKILRVSLAPLLTSGELVLRCVDNAYVRIFDNSDAEVIGPSVGAEHVIQASSVPAAGLEYRIEAITGGKEVTCVLTYKPAAAEIGPDAVKVSTVGMTALGAYYIASLHRNFAVNIADGAGQPTDKYYVGVESMSYPDHPAGVVVSLRNVVTLPVLENLKNGTYKMFNATVFTIGCAVPLEDSIKSDPDFQGLLALYQALYDPWMTEDVLYQWFVLSLGIPVSDAKYYWMLPRIYTSGAQVFEIVNYSAGGAKIKDITVTVLKVDMEYIGGTSATDARQEALLTLDDEYFMKSYMLKISAPAIQPGSTVTWSITKAGSPVGTYHNGSAWTDYGAPLVSTPTTQTIYWRSDTAGTITDVYKVSATFTPLGASTTATCTRDIKSRLLDPTIAQHRDGFNEDADMLQRAMIQLFYLDKGRLDVFRLGQYDTWGQNGFYHSSLVSRTIKDWSSVADEVWNFDRFALGSGSPPDPRPLVLSVVHGIWSEYALILAAGTQPSQDTTTPAYSSTWVPNAVTTAGLTVPAGFTKTSAQLLKALVTQEGGRHNYTRHNPLAVSCIAIGENTSTAGGAHAFTDGGLGYCKVQPYNAGGRNLYAPQDNLIRGAEILQVNIDDAANPGATANEKVWYAVFRYNRGNYGGVPIKTPLQLRSGGGLNAQSVAYADAIFGYLGLTPP